MHARRAARAVCVSAGRRPLTYVPAALAEAVRARVEVSGQLRSLLHQISQINLELLSRRELD